MNIHKSIFEFIEKKRVVTSSEIAKEFKINWNTAEKYLLETALDGKIERLKKSGVNLWVVKNE
jgi:predicted HTH transcriptional regulator